MNDYYSKELKKCVNNFIKLYNEDNYISKRVFDKYLDSYKDIFKLLPKYYNEEKENEDYKKVLKISQTGYKIISNKNDIYINKKLIDEKDYFDNLFKKIDPNINLDLEQRKAIICDEDYSLVIAGAGSGKTTTMVAKIKYLIEKRNVKPKEIVILAFTNKAVEDLNEMLNIKFKLNVEVLTFHKLGMKFMRMIYSRPIRIVSENETYNLFKNYILNNIFKNKELLRTYNTIFTKQLRLTDDCYKYNNYSEYYRKYTKDLYKLKENNLSEEIKKRVTTRTKYFKTINGELVKSLGELSIANYLYLHGIKYSYEKLYPYNTNSNRSYSPDFTIYTQSEIYYLEFFGLSNINNNVITSKTDKYQEEMKLKRQLHQKHDTNLIEIYYFDNRKDNYLTQLKIKLRENNIFERKRSDKEIFFRLLETSSDIPFLSLINLFSLFIGTFKELGYEYKDFSNLKLLTDDLTLKKQLDALEDVYKYYQNNLKLNFKIDFQDMINYSYKNMEYINTKTEINNYKYIVVDEYQDISKERYNFLKKLSNLFSAKIVAVGDDWQTIYSFSGSDINLFTRFYEMMGYAEIIKITNTYRNSQELIDLAGDFVLKDENQIVKKLHSNKHLKHPIELIDYVYNETENTIVENICKVIDNLYLENKNNNILLLGRYNDDIECLLNSRLFTKPVLSDDKIIYNKYPDCNIEFLTVHKSKGLGFDNVIIINALSGSKGFPSEIKDLPIIKLLKNKKDKDGNDISDYFNYTEERRLFYVALTRTKNKLYIMVPTNNSVKSDFISEIEDNKSVIEINNN